MLLLLTAAGGISPLPDQRVTLQTPDLAALAKKTHQHKYDHGHVLVLAGPPGHGGAARLAARGALRIGAGLVTLACPSPSLPENAAQMTAIMVRSYVGGAGLLKILSDGRFSVICLGPGLGVGATQSKVTRELVEVALTSGRKIVLDADALGVFAPDPENLFALLHEDVVLPPHMGEFSRLFPDIAEKLTVQKDNVANYTPAMAARTAARRAGCTVLLKGADTVIANQAGRCVAADQQRAAPWLATAGSGDVLAGFIAGLLARGFPPVDAAETAAWLHVECARTFGPGLIAEDLPDMLPGVFQALGI